MVAAGPSDLSRGRQHRTSASRAARTKITPGRPHSHPPQLDTPHGPQEATTPVGTHTHEDLRHRGAKRR